MTRPDTKTLALDRVDDALSYLGDAISQANRVREEVHRLARERDDARREVVEWKDRHARLIRASAPYSVQFAAARTEADGVRSQNEQMTDALLATEEERDALRSALDEVLDALEDMADQYLSGPAGHAYMGAGEDTTRILVKYRPDRWKDDGRGPVWIGGEGWADTWYPKETPR